MKKLLITGGAGFIGINTAKHFLDKGWRILIFDNLSRRGVENNLEILRSTYATWKFIKGDVRYEQELLRQALKESDAVLHLAAQVAVTKSLKNPREDFEINALGAFNVLEAAREIGFSGPILYSSTNKVYGGLEDWKVKKTTTRYVFCPDEINGVGERVGLDFHSPYGCSKGAADQYFCDYARIYDLKTVVLRQSCIYGTYQYGIEDQGWVAWFIIASLLGRPIKVYGTGRQVRDLLYVKDLVRLYECCIENVETAKGKIYNVGGGIKNTLSVLELLKIIESKLGKIDYSFAKERPGDQKIYISDIRKVTQELGWSPEVSIDTGISNLIDWAKDNLSLIEKSLS